MIEEQESLRKMFEPPEYVHKIIKEQETFREMFAPSGAVASAFQSIINQEYFNPLHITDSIKSLTDELSIPEFNINSDGILSFENQNIDLTELNIAVSTFFEEISDDSSIETAISRLVDLKKPAQSIAIWILNHIIIVFFVSVMAGLFTPCLQNIFDSKPLKSRRQVTHTIKNLSHEIDLYEYKGYRVVTADILNLRQKPNMKANVIGKLKRGKLVRVKKKKKNWTKVEVENRDSGGKRKRMGLYPIYCAH
ncbi:MAG: SH3 domain-containing protein [Desulfobacterales bacterium]|nr:SH3 domain-containing protein [Desulfobacterales bacterium]